MISERAEDEVNMIPYYVILLLIPLGVVISISWSIYQERRDRNRDGERNRMARIGDIEMETFANPRRRPGSHFPWTRANIASGEELSAGGHEDDDGITLDSHVAAPVRISRQRQERTVDSREEFTTHRQARREQGFGSLESDPAGAGLFGGGPNLSPVLEDGSMLDSVFLTHMDYDVNSAQAQLQTLLGLIYTPQATIGTPFSHELKVYTV